MPGADRKGDTNSAGGVAGGGETSVKINGRNAMTPGQSVSPHPCCGKPPPACKVHCRAKTGRGTRKVLVGGRQLVLKGSSDTCAHRRSSASRDVLVG